MCPPTNYTNEKTRKKKSCRANTYLRINIQCIPYLLCTERAFVVRSKIFKNKWVRTSERIIYSLFCHRRRRRLRCRHRSHWRCFCCQVHCDNMMLITIFLSENVSRKIAKKLRYILKSFHKYQMYWMNIATAENTPPQKPPNKYTLNFNLLKLKTANFKTLFCVILI